jgi:hypothetical protein
MEIAGEWQLCDDGVTRPLLRVHVLDQRCVAVAEYFLVDNGSDRTVFTAGLMEKLDLPLKRPESEVELLGVGGRSTFAVVTTAIEFVRRDGAMARVRGDFGVFTDASALDVSILGRDVLNHFDVILSRRRNELLLLAPPHQYRVVSVV